MRITIYVREDLQVQANDLTRPRDNGDTFAVPLTENGTDVVGYWASWEADASRDSQLLDGEGRFDLRDEMEGTSPFEQIKQGVGGDGRFVDPSGRYAVYEGWAPEDVLTDLGFSRWSEGET